MAVKEQDCLLHRDQYSVVYERLRKAGYSWTSKAGYSLGSKDVGEDYNPFKGKSVDTLYIFTSSHSDRSNMLLWGDDAVENDDCSRLDLRPYLIPSTAPEDLDF